MSGTRIGGLKTAKTNAKKYGEDFYANIGRKGGTTPNKAPKGFAANPALAKAAGMKGGLISRRGGQLDLWRHKKEILESYHAGTRTKYIADEYRCSVPTMRKYIREWLKEDE